VMVRKNNVFMCIAGTAVLKELIDFSSVCGTGY